MFNKMKIGLRLALGFGVMIVLLISLIVVGFISMSAVDASLKRVVEMEDVSKELAHDMMDNTRDGAVEIRNLVLQKDSAKVEQALDKIAMLRQQYDTDFKKYESMTTKDETEILDSINKINVLRDTARKSRDILIDLIATGKKDEAVDWLNTDTSPKVSNWIESMDELVKLENQYTTRSYQAAQTAYDNNLIFTIVLGIAALLLAVLMSVFLTRSITRPLDVAIKLVTSRDLTVDLSDYAKGRDELAFMIQSFGKEITAQKKAEDELIKNKEHLEETVQQRTAELTNILKEVQETTNVLSSSSSEILAATTQVVSGSTETATAVSETTTTVEEVKQTSQLTSQKARYVSDNAEKAMQAAKAGRKAVEETVESVNHIREQIESIAESIVKLSEQGQAVGEIVATVTDIAEQVNLLSVNAAIEAARAGEQGKGFSVVAHEIKSLAEQSKQATSQVRTILNDVQKGISSAVMVTEQGSKAADAGVKQAAEAGQAIKMLTDSVTESAQAATQIAASSQQQAVGMDQVVAAMENIKKASAESLSSTKQVEISASDLNKLSQKLKDMVSKFKA